LEWLPVCFLVSVPPALLQPLQQIILRVYDNGRKMTIDQSNIELPTQQIKEFCNKYGVAQFALFGSVLRDDFGPDSDVDVMLKFKPGHGFTFENTPDIQDELRAIFKRKVDVIEMGRIRNPVRRRAIMDSHRIIYAA